MARAVRLLTEVSAVDRAFDYRLPETMATVGVGDRLRVDFHGRSVRGWVLEEVPDAPELNTVKSWLGYGPPPAMAPLFEWAARRWCAPLASFYRSASDVRLHKSLPTPPAALAVPDVVPRESGVWQLAPTTDPIDIVLAAYESTRGRGSLLVLTPTDAWAERLAARLRRRGLFVAQGEQAWPQARAGWPVVVGARGVAFAPLPTVAGAVILDADDEAYRSGQFPYWHARDVIVERCARAHAPWWATSSWPTPTLATCGPTYADPLWRGGWPRVEVVDRRQRDPHDGVLSPNALAEAHRALAGDEPVAVAVILQRLGAGRVLACKRCGELARCGECGRACEETDAGRTCPDAHSGDVTYCTSCGATAFRAVRSGVTTLARDVALQLNCEVTEVTAQSESATFARVVVGTEAVFGRVRRCAAVIFVDADQYLTAPRSTARRAFVEAVGRAGRLVGARREGRGVVVVQTRRPDDEVVLGVVNEDVGELSRDEIDTAKVLGLAPYRARATLTGEGAPVWAAQLTGLDVRPVPDGVELSAPDLATLTDAIALVGRPGAPLRLTIE